MSPSIRFEPYRSVDLESCVQIFESNIPEFFRDHEVPGYRRYLEQHATGRYWCVYEGDELVGCGGIHVADDGHARLCYGMIRADRHKHGYGRALAEFRIAEIHKDPRAVSIGLDTSQHHPEFFAKFGFVPVSVEKDKYAPGLDSHEMILVLKR